MTVEEILAALQAIVDEAKGEPLTDDQVERYEKLEADLKKRQASDAVQQRHAAYNAVTTAPVIPGDTSTKDPEEQLNRAFNHYLRTGKPNADIADLHRDRQGTDATGRQTRAQSEGVASEGGYLVPAGFRNKLQERMKAFGGIAQDVENINTTTGEALPWPTLDDTANVGQIVKEGNTFTSGADVVFGEKSLGAYEYMAGGAGGNPLRVSTVLLNDAAFDVEGLISRLLGQRIARIQAPHLISGTGNEEPEGILTGLTGVQMAANTGPTYDDILTWIHSVDPAYREQGCQWGFNDTSLLEIEKIKDSHGDPIWRPDNANMSTDASGGGNGNLLGYRVRIDQSFPNMVKNSGVINWGVFGDLKTGYVKRNVKDVQLLVNPYARMSYRQIEYSVWARMDAVQQDTNAYVALTGKA